MSSFCNKKTTCAALKDSDFLVSQALLCLETRLRSASEMLNNSLDVGKYLRLHLADEQNEVFAVLFLDSQHRLLAFEKLFYGTVNETAVYPRTIVRRVLEHNASKVIIAHNHPSGSCVPSDADKKITEQLQEVLEAISAPLIDHVIVTHQNSYSFAECGLL